jgi:hypothetical protein
MGFTTFCHRHCSKASKETKQWEGIELLPQADIATGMALVASKYFPEYRQTLFSRLDDLQSDLAVTRIDQTELFSGGT